MFIEKLYEQEKPTFFFLTVLLCFLMTACEDTIPAEETEKDVE